MRNRSVLKLCLVAGVILTTSSTAVAQSNDGPQVPAVCRSAMLKVRAKQIGLAAAAVLSAETGKNYKFKSSEYQLLEPRPVARIPLAQLIAENMSVVDAHTPVIDLAGVPTIESCRLSVRFYYTLKVNGKKVRGFVDQDVDGSLLPDKNPD